MLRKSWILGLVAGLGLLAIAPVARASDFYGANDTISVGWGGHFGRGCNTCGSGYYAPYSGYGYGYIAAPTYWGGGWGASFGPAYAAPSGYWGTTAAPANYWHGYAASYSYGWGSPYSYGYAAGYPAAYGYGYGAGYPSAYGYGYGAGYPSAYGYGYTQPYSYYAPTSCSTCWTPSTYYYQPVAAYAVPYVYTAPAVANIYTTTARVVTYPQAAPIAVAPQYAPGAAPYVAPAPQAPGFDYNGGPSNPVPMPRLEPQPAPASGPGIFNIKLADDDKASSSKYAFKAYGEKATTSSSSLDKTILVKDVK